MESSSALIQTPGKRLDAGSGSLSFTGNISIPTVAAPDSPSNLIASGDPVPTDKGWTFRAAKREHLFHNRLGTGNSTARISAGLPFSTAKSVTLTYNAATKAATIYLGSSSSPHRRRSRCLRPTSLAVTRSISTTHTDRVQRDEHLTMPPSGTVPC